MLSTRPSFPSISPSVEPDRLVAAFLLPLLESALPSRRQRQQRWVWQSRARAQLSQNCEILTLLLKFAIRVNANEQATRVSRASLFRPRRRKSMVRRPRHMGKSPYDESFSFDILSYSSPPSVPVYFCFSSSAAAACRNPSSSSFFIGYVCGPSSG